MKCPKCLEENKKSRVYPGTSTTTAMYGEEFFDEEGNHHVHDPNTTKTYYTCSEGHTWIEERKRTCRACRAKQELPAVNTF